jgi:FkbM family methyltransferase
MDPAEPRLKRSLKAVRGWRPVNGVATTVVRSLSRLTGREFKSAIKHLPRSGPVNARLPNGELMRLESRGDDWVSNQVFWRGWEAYEPETVPLFYSLATRSDVVLDVGAFVGFFTVLAGLANRDGRVFAFEPMPGSFERARRHLELNRLDNVELVQAAVSETDGEADLFYSGDLPSSTSLVHDFMRAHPNLESFSVPTVTLDAFLAERGSPAVSLVKLDIETGEPAALRGMEGTLEAHRPTIVCEVLSTEVGEEVLEILSPFGYRCFHLTAEGPLERTAIEAHPELLNWLFTVMPRDQLDALVHEATLD